MLSINKHRRSGQYLFDALIIVIVIYLFSHAGLLDWDDQQLQQTGEHSESATLPILAEIGLKRYGEIPLWNPYMLTGYPHVGDLINHFWNPIATIPVMIWGGINGMKVSVFLSLLVAATGQYVLAHVFGMRGIFRLWAGLMFALSGGLALLWWLGWYELLVGVTWIPWSMAALWVALSRRDALSLVLAAAANALVLTTGGGYYPLYLGVILIILTALALMWQKPNGRGRLIQRALIIAGLSIGLSAVYLVPLIDGWQLTARDTPPDLPQYNSQTIVYALINYVVADSAWFRADVLGKTSGSGWYYIGILPLLGLALIPWYYAFFRWRRRTIITLLVLILLLLAWHANRHTPVKYIYDWLPFLYTFRFPNRLLIIIASPIILLAGLSLQGLLVRLRATARQINLTISPRHEETGKRVISLALVVNVVAAATLFWGLYTVYQVNKPFATAPHARNTDARDILPWLRQYDPNLYYVDLGGDRIFWNWMSHAYELEMPVINFRYNRRLRSMDEQFGPESPFRAQPKYIVAGNNYIAPEGAELIHTDNGLNIWYRPDALPYAFLIESPGEPVNNQTTSPVSVRLDGPNRIVLNNVMGEAGTPLVVLMSDYTGWRLSIDGQSAAVQPLNGYLGATLLEGVHDYVFEFHPRQHDIGLAITLLSLAVSAVFVGREWLSRRQPRAAVEQQTRIIENQE